MKVYCLFVGNNGLDYGDHEFLEKIYKNKDAAILEAEKMFDLESRKMLDGKLGLESKYKIEYNDSCTYYGRDYCFWKGITILNIRDDWKDPEGYSVQILEMEVQND